MTEPNDLPAKLTQWLNQQGYPTEFRVANICQRNGFRIRQGEYVEDDKSDTVREIDVLASCDHASRDFLIRIEYVIECKWSKDKPWVVFTSSAGRMPESACIAQTIGNNFGSTILWAIAGEKELQKLDSFSSPERPGFGGRQGFSHGSDLFYSSVQSVTDAAVLLMDWYDRNSKKVGELPYSIVISLSSDCRRWESI